MDIAELSHFFFGVGNTLLGNVSTHSQVLFINQHTLQTSLSLAGLTSAAARSVRITENCCQSVLDQDLKRLGEESKQ